MARRKVFSIEELNNDHSKVAQLLSGESPLASVLVGGAYIDKLLAVILRHFFVAPENIVLEVFDQGQVLENAGAQNKIAFCCGLIPENVYNNIAIIQKIRNRFAHSHVPIDFDDDVILNLCRNMTFLADQELDDRMREKFKHNPRTLFVYSVSMCLGVLRVRAGDTERVRIEQEWEQTLHETAAEYLKEVLERD